jgi:hypothetical protein
MDTTPYVQKTLFQLPYLSEEQMRAIIKPLHPFLWPLVMEPWDDLLERRGHDRMFTDMTEDEMAIWLTMQAGKLARSVFHGREGIEVKTWYRKPVIVIPDALAIVVKKLTKRRLRRRGPKQLSRSNALTETNRNFWNQQHVDGLPDIPRVIFGYELIREATEIRLYIAYPRTRGRGTEWAYRLRAPRVANPPFPKLKVIPIQDEQKPFTISAAEPGDHKNAGGKG